MAAPSDLVAQYLDRWRSRLLDLTRRNPLVSLRGARKGCLPLSRPIPQALLDTLVNQCLPLTFWMPPVDEETSGPRRRGRRAALDAGRHDPHAGQLLCGDLGRRELHTALTNLYRRSHADHRERGLHTLHVVFGVVEWQEKGKPGTLRSPLLLLPVRLSRASLSSPFTLVGVDEAPLLNPALDARFRRDDVGVRLPSPPEDWNGAALTDWFRAVEAVLPRTKLDRSALLTLLSFHKGVMYQDLADNAERFMTHPLVRALAGAEALPPQPAAPEERTLDAVPPEDTFHILDADASQRVCLEAARRGQSFALLGPPGTGKSQTIANLIAAALADGKTVLFVSEKVAALEVVSGRLQRAGLGDLLLELHGGRAGKQEVAEELWRCLHQPCPPESSHDEPSFSRLQLRRDQLNDCVRALHEPRPPLGKSVRQAFGEVARREGIVRLPLGLSDPLAITPEWLERAEGLARRTQQLWHVILEGEGFPWRGFRAPCCTLALRGDIAELLERVRVSAEQLQSLSADASARLGLKGQVDPAFLLGLLDLLEVSPSPPATWLQTADLSELAADAKRLAEEFQDWQRRREALVARRGLGVLSLPDRTADALRSACRSAESLLAATDPVPAGASELLGWARDTRERIPAWQSAAGVLARWFGIALDAPPFAALAGLLRLLELSQTGAQPDRTWFDPLALRRAREAIRHGRDAYADHRRRRDWLLTRYDERLFDLDLDRLAERFSGPYRGWLRSLYPGYHAACRRLARVSRDGTVPPTVREDILSAREVRSLHRRLRADQPLYSAALGHFYQGLHSDLDAAARAVAVAEEALAIAQRFGWNPFPSPLAEVFAGGTRPPVDVAVAARQLGESLRDWEGRTAPLRGMLRLDDIPDRGCPLDDATLTELQQYATRVGDVLGPLGPLVDQVLPGNDLVALLADLHEAEAFRAWQASMATVEEWCVRFGPWYRGADTDWTALRAALDWARRLRDLFAGSLPRPVVRLALGGPNVVPSAEPLRAAAVGLREVVAALEARFDPPGPGLDGLPPEALERRMAAMLDRIAELQDELDWRALAVRHAELGLGDFWEALCREKPPADQVVDALLLAVHRDWAAAVCEREPVLRDFRRSEHEERIAEFVGLDRDSVRSAAARVTRLTAGRRPDPAGSDLSSEVTLLGREVSKRTRRLPLRRLFEETPNLVQRLKPCLLLSPLTVSQYLNPETMQFDLVVFDEASQICPEDAVGAIVRGRQWIVAGDSRQLPPTAFFQGAVEEGDGETDAPADYTSILDACQGAGLPVRMLRWHYRSRHESLIAYSNRHFYGNRLVTFPAARSGCPSLGVHLVRVPDGVYDRGGRCDNVREAAAVADIVVSHFRERPEKTLGVIAFSHAQMNAVADEVERRAREAPELEPFLAEDRLEGFFVKNLETVQGDERDVIVFSIGYGRDADGRLAMNFGPLNQDDGERRLNVAITRAREKVIVVSSLEARDLRVTPATPTGVQHLRRYLEFAADAGRTDGGWHDAAKTASPVEEDVCRVVEAFGYPVVRDVGYGEFRIDLGVIDPGRPNAFLLAIECDGGAYQAAATARDRDRLRSEMLQSLGWRIHRVWSPEWFRDRGEEIARLREALEAARLQWTLPRRTRLTPVPSELFAEPARRPSLNGHLFSGSVLYRVCDLGVREEFRGGGFTDRAARQEQARLLARLVDAEGPVHVEVATERLRKAWGRSRTGERMRQAVEEAVAFCEARGQLGRRGEFLWPVPVRQPLVRVPDLAVPESYRDVLHIAAEELQAGLRLLLRQGLGEDEEELLGQAARLFGFGRLGDHIRRRLIDNLAEVKKYAGGRLLSPTDGFCLSGKQS